MTFHSNFEFEDDTPIGALTHDGRGMLPDVAGRASLPTLAGEDGERIRSVSGRAKEPPGLSAVLIRPDGVVGARRGMAEPA